MLDINKEIKEYQEIELGNEVDSGKGELGEIIGSFAKVLERLSKEQYRSTKQLEDIYSLLEQDGEEGGSSREIQKELEKREQEVEDLLQLLLQVGDSLEDIYRYALRSDQEAWKKQLFLQWEKTDQHMEKYGIKRIEGTGAFFDQQLHVAREVTEFPGVSDGQILDVLRSGYLYKEKTLRKAEVIVNRFKG